MRKVSKIIPEARSEALDYVAHATTFGVARGTLLFTASHVRPKKAGRQVTVKLPGTDVALTVRLGTSDMRVFQEIFWNYEYDWNFNTAPGVIVDVGGYIGLSAAFFAHKYPQARIIAIEPDANNFELLKLNTSHFPNVHPVRAAVWRESGTISLTDPGTGAWGLQVREAETKATPHSGHVRAVTIGEVMKEFNLGRIDLLKVDVEGSEKEIFATASSWTPFVDVICIELHDRFKTGCSRSFFGAVDEFPIELRRSEDVLVARAESPLVPVSPRLA